LASKK